MLFETYNAKYPFYMFYNGQLTKILPAVTYIRNFPNDGRRVHKPEVLYNFGKVNVDVNQYEIHFSLAVDGDAAVKPYKDLNDAKVIVSSDTSETIDKLYKEYDATGQIDFENSVAKDFRSSYKVTLSLGKTEYDLTDKEFSITWVNPYVALINNASDNTVVIYSTKLLNEVLVLDLIANTEYMGLHFKPDILFKENIDADIRTNGHVIAKIGLVKRNLRLLYNATRSKKRIVKLFYNKSHPFIDEYIWQSN